MTTKTNIALAQQKLEELLMPLGRQKVIMLLPKKDAVGWPPKRAFKIQKLMSS